MKNKEWIGMISSEKAADILDWVLHEYGRRFTDSRYGVIQWLDTVHIGSEVGTCPCCLHKMVAIGLYVNKCDHCGFIEEVGKETIYRDLKE